MKSYCALFAMLTSCSGFYFNTPSIEVVRGGSTSVPIVAAGYVAAPKLLLTPLPADGGVTAELQLLPPNPKNFRGVVFVRASDTAPLGKTRVTVTLDDQSQGLDVIVKAAPALTLTRDTQAHTTIATSLGDTAQSEWFVWIRSDGTVMQRRGTSNLPVPMLSHVVSVSAGLWAWAVTSTGELYRWDPAATPVTPSKVLDGVTDVSACRNVSYALKTDGSVVDLDTLLPVSDLSDVVSIRVFSFTQQIINGGGTYVAAGRTFLKADGTVEGRSTVTFVEGQLPNQVSPPTFSQGVRAITAHGFVQSADGLPTYAGALVHEVPVKKISSSRTSQQFNATTSSSAVQCYALFDDGALWLTSLSKTNGENQQGAPTLSTNATQIPLRAPGDAAISDFAVLGTAVLIVTTAGDIYVTAGDGTFGPSPFTDLKH